MTKPLKNACTVCSVQAFYFTKVWIPCLDEALTISQLVAMMNTPIGPDKYPDATLAKVKEEIEKLSLVSRVPMHPHSLHTMSVPSRKKMLFAAKEARVAQNDYDESLYQLIIGRRFHCSVDADR